MEHYYHNLIKKYTIAVGYIFRDIHVYKYDEGNVLQKDITVPCAYYGKERAMLMHNQRHSDFNNQEIAFDKTDRELNIAGLVPRIGFTDGAPVYDGSRKKNSSIIYTSDDQNYEIGVPIPYNIPFEVHVHTKRKDDMNQIIEQILPIFTPDVMININVIPELNIVDKVPIIMNGLQYDNSIEYGQDGERFFKSTFNLTAKGHFYPAIKDTGLITIIKLNYRKMQDC